MVTLVEASWGSVAVLLTALAGGAAGGLAYDLLDRRKVTIARRDGLPTAGSISGWWAVVSMLLGGLSAVGFIYFLPPERTTIQLTTEVTRTLVHYDLLRLVPLSVIIGSAGGSFLSAMQNRIAAQVADDRRTTTQEVSKQQIDAFVQSAKQEVERTAQQQVTDAIALVRTQLETAARAPAAKGLAPKQVEAVQNTLNDLPRQIAESFGEAVSDQAGTAKSTIDIAAGASPELVLHGSVSGFARHSLPNWSESYEERADGQVLCQIHSGDGDTRSLRECIVTAPDEVTATAQPEHLGQARAYFSFTYPGDFEGGKSVPLPDGQYRIEWTSRDGQLIRLHAFSIEGGHLAR